MKYELFNQFNHPVEVEFPHTPRDQKNWTEHYYFWFYDPQTKYGIYIHMARLVSDPSIWRPVVQIYLPDGDFLCSTSHGNIDTRTGPGAGPLKLNCIEPHRSWSVHFDGVGARATRDELMSGLIDDRPVEPIRFSLLFDGAAPNFGKHVWGNDSGVATFHTEQICKVRGHFVQDGKIVHVEGVGARDHSTGPRDYAPVIGDIWFQCLFEDGDAIMAQVVHFDAVKIKAAYYYKAGTDKIEDLEVLEHPTVAPAEGAPLLNRDPLADAEKDFILRLKRENGEEIKLEVSLITACAVTLKSPVEEYHGTGEGAGLQMAECAARVKWGDKIGYANRERSSRLTALAG